MNKPAKPRREETGMAVFLGSIVLNTADTVRSARFWTEALGYVSQSETPEFLVPPEWRPPSNSRHDHGDGMHLHLDRDDKMHLDLWVDQNSNLRGEVERLVSLGAIRVDWTYPQGAGHVVLADPDGNLFCVVG